VVSELQPTVSGGAEGQAGVLFGPRKRWERQPQEWLPKARVAEGDSLPRQLHSKVPSTPTTLQYAI